MTSKTNTGVTTTVTTLARVAEAAEAKGSTIPDLLLHEYLLAERAENRAKESKARLADAMREYMTSEHTNELESAEAKALRYDVKNQGKLDREGLERDYPVVYATYYKPGNGTHEALRVTPRA